jgi:hypothetical protein
LSKPWLKWRAEEVRKDRIGEARASDSGVVEKHETLEPTIMVMYEGELGEHVGTEYRTVEGE